MHPAESAVEAAPRMLCVCWCAVRGQQLHKQRPMCRYALRAVRTARSFRAG